MKKLGIIVLIVLTIFAATATRYPGGTMTGNLDMLGHTITNATIITATNIEEDLAQLESDLGNTTEAQEQDAADIWQLESDLGNTSADILQLLLDLGNTTEAQEQDAADISQLESDLGNTTDNVTQLQNTQSYLNVIAGGSPGNRTLTGVLVGGSLNGVLYIDNASPPQFSDLGDEFSIIDSDIIANNESNGTDTTNGFLIISWSQ
jgi:hypothetical protein